VEKGEKIALIGHNGVGKTTLCNILMEQLESDTGSVKWGATITSSYFPQNATDMITGDFNSLSGCNSTMIKKIWTKLESV